MEIRIDELDPKIPVDGDQGVLLLGKACRLADADASVGPVDFGRDKLVDE